MSWFKRFWLWCWRGWWRREYSTACLKLELEQMRSTTWGSTRFHGDYVHHLRGRVREVRAQLEARGIEVP